MNVLSVFDGISCGMLALQRANVKVSNYYASEICRQAERVSKHNFPDIKRVGNVLEVEAKKLPKLDLLIGGSPCQGFSFSGKQLNFEDPRSKLFFEFVRLLREAREINPDLKFMLENVPMKKEYEEVITSYLGVEPIKINSSLVSAQNRNRLYWSNIPGIEQPENKNIPLKDILDQKDLDSPEAIRGRYLNKATIIGRRLNDRGKREDYNKNLKITQCLEVRSTNTDKSNCLTTVDKDNVLTCLAPGRYPDAFSLKDKFRYYSIREKLLLQTMPEDFFPDNISYSQATKMLGNGWTVDIMAHIFKNLVKNDFSENLDF